MHLWRALAERYRDEPAVAGYNLLNEPADPSGKVVGPFHDRLVAAVRDEDPDHIVFVDGNTYSTDFSAFAKPYPNCVFACHDYARAGMAYGGPYPGETAGTWVDRDTLEETFLKRTAFMRETGTPIWVGEFGPVYTGDPERDDMRYQVLCDQLEIYERHAAGWSLWTYKDVGLQGLVSVAPDSPYLRRFGDLIAKKARLGVDSWGSTDAELPELFEPLHAADRERVPAVVAVPVERALEHRRRRAAPAVRAGDAARVRGALPRPERRRAGCAGGLVPARELRRPRAPARCAARAAPGRIGR